MSGPTVAFAGVAHSHPFADAVNLRARGATVAGVWDADDSERRDDFARRTGAEVHPDLGMLLAARPDLVVATPRTPRATEVMRACGAVGIPVFFNKTVAASEEALTSFGAAARGARASTSSVLRFAPAVAVFAERMRDVRPLAVDVVAQHDIAGFLTPGREWQDDPSGAGGTLVNVGVHAVDLLDAVLPGMRTQVRSVRGFRGGAPIRSELAAVIRGTAADDRSGAGAVDVTVTVSGVPGPDRYSVRVLADDGMHELVLGDGDDLGYSGLADRLIHWASGGPAPVAWERSAAGYRFLLATAAEVRG